MDKDLIKLIESLGFKEKESKVYLALLELGKANISEVSKQAQIKRPTAYLIIENLVKNGYATEVPFGAVKKYQAIDPSIILIKKKAELKNFSEMVPFLQTIQNKGDFNPQIHYVSTLEGIWNIYESLNYAKEALCISSYHKINEHFPGKVDYWIKEYEKNSYSVKTKHLIPNSPKEIEYGKRFKDAGQTVRILPKNFNTDIVITEDKISISSLEEKPFLVLIESRKLASSLRPIFEIIWEISSDL